MSKPVFGRSDRYGPRRRKPGGTESSRDRIAHGAHSSAEGIGGAATHARCIGGGVVFAQAKQPGAAGGDPYSQFSPRAAGFTHSLVSLEHCSPLTQSPSAEQACPAVKRATHLAGQVPALDWQMALPAQSSFDIAVAAQRHYTIHCGQACRLVALEQPIAGETAKGVEASLSLGAIVFDGARCNLLLHQCEGSVLEALGGHVHAVVAAEVQRKKPPNPRNSEAPCIRPQRTWRVGRRLERSRRWNRCRCRRERARSQSKT